VICSAGCWSSSSSSLSSLSDDDDDDEVAMRIGMPVSNAINSAPVDLFA
jgi:hypothetical protein